MTAKQLNLFAEQQALDQKNDHIDAMRICWPEWDGPKVGYCCEVWSCFAEHLEEGKDHYHNSERVRLIEQREDGCWIGKIEHSEKTLADAPWMADSQGIRLVLPITNIWPPTDDLLKERSEP